MNLVNLLQTLRRWDERRPSIPGEHWMTFAAGLRMLTSRRSGLLSKAIGGALVYRSLRGRDGLLALLQRDLPLVEGRRLTLMDGTVVASAAEPDLVVGSTPERPPAAGSPATSR